MGPHLATPRFVLAVPDAETTALWWTGVMGFRRVFETPGWVFVRAGDCEIRLGSCPDALPPRDLGDHSYFGYVAIDDVDAYHRAIAAAGAEIIVPPTDRSWGMREMAVRTPDGHRIMFGAPLRP